MPVGNPHGIITGLKLSKNNFWHWLREQAQGRSAINDLLRERSEKLKDLDSKYASGLDRISLFLPENEELGFEAFRIPSRSDRPLATCLISLLRWGNVIPRGQFILPDGVAAMSIESFKGPKKNLVNFPAPELKGWVTPQEKRERETRKLPTWLTSLWKRALKNITEPDLSADDWDRIAAHAAERAEIIRRAEYRRRIDELAHQVFPELATGIEVDGPQLTMLFAERSRLQLEPDGGDASAKAEISDDKKPAVSEITKLTKKIDGTVVFDDAKCRLSIVRRADSKDQYSVATGKKTELWRNAAIPPLQFSF